MLISIVPRLSTGKQENRQPIKQPNGRNSDKKIRRSALLENNGSNATLIEHRSDSVRRSD